MRSTTQNTTAFFPIALLTILFTTGLSTITWAADPPSTGVPGGRADAGSRGCDELITALPSPQPLSSSTTTYPTFWFALPKVRSYTAKFTLQDRTGNFLYQSDIDLSKHSNTVGVTVPSNIAPLAIGEQYQWFLKLYCETSAPPTTFINGWMQPTHPDMKTAISP